MKNEIVKRKPLTFAIQEQRKVLKNGIEFPYLSFPLLEKETWATHCFTTRKGGVSQGIFESLNLSFTRGDDKKAVEENFQRVAEVMEAKCHQFVFSDQTHTNHVRTITKEDAGNGLTKEKTFFDIDGMITNEPGLVLSTFYADCVPLYFLDPVNHVIGLSHSGWRGTVGKIGKVTIEAMEKEYGTNPKELLCAIGPSICQACYEVSEDVAVEFQKAFSDQVKEILYQKENGKYRLDLWKANEIIFLEEGVLKENIAVSKLCTCCNSSYLFSHRASQGKRGNLGAFFMIKPK